MLLEAADGSEERERRRSGSPDYRDRRRERYPPGAYGVNGHYGAPPPHAMGPGSYHAGYPHASGAMPPGPLPAPGQLQTYQTHIFAPPVTGAPVKKPKGGAPPMPLPGPGTAPQGHAVQQQPLVPAGSTGSVMTLGPNGSVISGPSTVGGPGGFPPTNNSGQRICRQCGVAGRYKDGKCVEKWGPGPEGPGTVCDRCRKKMKRVERRGTMEAQQIARGDAAALAHHHSIPRQPPTAVGLQRTGTEALSVPAPQGPGLGPHGTQLLSPRGSFREVTNTGVGAAVNGTSARKSSSPYTSARRHFSPPYGHGTSDRHRAKSHSGSSVSGSPLSQPSGASSTEKVPSPELRDSRTGNNAMEVDEGDADAEGDEIDADADGETNVEGEAEVDAEADADAELLEAVDAAEAAHAGDD
ncbi:hypothetical protein PUNSTDRAFT_55576 [Punctularia strigosozonata HHB-11173 SS5]|uniref:Uncharacterized protein n=1 Tax=Punctularia strigosozonata (strain HHB-11173) TaxID=741275 RepID=R7S4R9_PUNST|nr:uncharacterized protein PUNSTDRAFT_55576 [Punctularia strigosozonata HHB-11173 SS5]EIN04241.1 hypothetical protein PUNSTDRAFT_55576 [Punctularia strigosozonata HHB-11173 SS5]